MVFLLGILEVATKDFFREIKETGMVKFFGLMEIFIGVGGKMVLSMAKGSYL